LRIDQPVLCKWNDTVYPCTVAKIESNGKCVVQKDGKTQTVNMVDMLMDEARDEEVITPLLLAISSFFSSSLFLCYLNQGSSGRGHSERNNEKDL